jgi:TfoX/Sxy family transcriptional regulator of competence genes
MAYDEHLAERVRQPLPEEGVAGEQMFGGIAFLYRSNMSVGVIGDDLYVRLSKKEGARALAEPHARPMDFTGKPMKAGSTSPWAGPSATRTCDAGSSVR